MATFRVLKKVFSRGFLVAVLAIELKLDFLLSQNCHTRITCVNLVLRQQIFDIFSRNCCVILAITECTHKHLIIERGL